MLIGTPNDSLKIVDSQDCNWFKSIFKNRLVHLSAPITGIQNGVLKTVGAQLFLNP